jgi:hypothetical protein
VSTTEELLKTLETAKSFLVLPESNYHANLDEIAAILRQREARENEVKRLKAERDAAIADLRETSYAYRICAACKWLGSNGGCKEPNPSTFCASNGPSKWQWRGVQVKEKQR